MTKVQQVYRILRAAVSKEDARYAAPKLAELTKQMKQNSSS